MINCAEAVKRLWDYIENDLAQSGQEEMEEHLAFCRRCCGEVDFAQELRAVMRYASKPQVPDEVSERLESYLDDLEGSSQ